MCSFATQTSLLYVLMPSQRHVETLWSSQNESDFLTAYRLLETALRWSKLPHALIDIMGAASQLGQKQGIRAKLGVRTFKLCEPLLLWLEAALGSTAPGKSSLSSAAALQPYPRGSTALQACHGPVRKVGKDR